MKEAELRRLAKCNECGRKIGQTGTPILWKVTMERHILDLHAIQRQTGLAMMLGGNGALASAMGTDEEMTKPLGPVQTVMICDTCAYQDIILMAHYEGEQAACPPCDSVNSEILSKP